MARLDRRRLPVHLVIVVGMVGMLFGSLPIAPAFAVTVPTDRLPDLKVARTTDFYIQKTASGRRLLRFTGAMLNVGTGAFEVSARRASTKKPWLVDQIIYQSGGHTRRIQTTATMKWAGDGHNHWHVTRMLTFHLWSPTGIVTSAGTGTLRAAKLGFCFFDTNRKNTSLPFARLSQKYKKTGCGTKSSLHTRNGISVGWSDVYPANFVYQWIDITGMPAGTYTVRGAVDLYGKFLESNDKNNCTWSRISFKATGPKVKVLATGSSCINDHDSTPFAADVTWALALGLVKDCDADMFCTNDPVSRSQLASFLARAMNLPPATTDHFTDDQADPNQADINRVAEAGLMPGCTATTFCPKTRVTREVLAAVLANALVLPPATTDHFTDDEMSALQPSINSVAEAGIMPGCTTTTFCPTTTVTRGAAMTIFHMAFPALVPPATTGLGTSPVGLPARDFAAVARLDPECALV